MTPFDRSYQGINITDPQTRCPDNAATREIWHMSQHWTQAKCLAAMGFCFIFLPITGQDARGVTSRGTRHLRCDIIAAIELLLMISAVKCILIQCFLVMYYPNRMEQNVLFLRVQMSTLIQVIARHLKCNKQLLEPMFIKMFDTICITKPQWVHILSPIDVLIHQQLLS